MCVLATARIARAQTPVPAPTPLPADERYQQALDQYEHGDYAIAAESFRTLLYPLAIFDPDRIRRAHLYRGISLWFTNDHAGADGEFYQVLLGDPDFRPDPLFTPPPVIAEIDSLRVAHAADLRKVPRLPHHGVDEPHDPLGIPLTAQGPGPTLDFLLSAAPFGIGQLHNKQPVKAYALLGAETIFTTVDLSTYIALKAQEKSGHHFTDVASANRLKQINNASFALLAGTLVYGVADGVITNLKHGGSSAPPPALAPAVGPGMVGMVYTRRF